MDLERSQSHPQAPGGAPRQRAYPAEKARQGYIALNTPARRIIFIGGLALAVLLGLLMTILAVLS